MNLSDDLSKVLYQKLTLITGWGIWIYFLIALMESLGLPLLVSKLFNQALGLAVVFQVIRIILENHKAVTAFVERRFFTSQEDFKKQRRFLEAFLQIWHIPIIILVVLIYLLNFFGIGGGFQSLLLQTGFSLIIVMAARFLRNTIKLYRKEKIDFFISSKYHKIHKKLKLRVDFFEGVLAYVIYLGALQIQFIVWGMSLMGVFKNHQDHTYSFFKLLFKMGSILFLAYSIWIFVDLLIDYHIAKEDEKASRVGKSMSARIRTLVPILRNTLLVTLSAFVVIVFLSNLGIDTGPILGGVAIFSFAISFGAQSLVKDVFTGFFIILEDAVAVDDTIEIDGKKGIVEAVTIRSIRLRDDNGSVHTIPFGEVKVLTNMTRDYSYAVIEVTLPNEKSYEQIVSIVFETGNHLALDPNFGPLILEPLEIKGIEQFTETGIAFCCRIKTKPGEQLKVKREFYRCFKTALDKADIALPTIQKAVYLNPDL